MSDAELVSASRNGNREAFGQIVRRYQGMISGLIYAACGDLHRSEDIAQETFISAWKSLSGLRDASKLPSWLCQIARHRIADHFREPATQKMQLQEQLAETIPAQASPEKMSAEEGEMLWRTLSRIPQPYRETMVLYYRQGQSTAEVAAAMETTDAGVRQRLSRGREMLREELAALLEHGLSRSAPGPEFSLAVLGALPLAAAQTATLGATAKGSAAAKGGLIFFLTTWLAPIAAILSMGMITAQSIYRAKAGNRWFVAAYWAVFWAVVIGWVFFCNGLVDFGRHRHWNYRTFIPVLSASWCIFSMLLFAMTAWSCPRDCTIENADHPHLMGRFWPRFIFLTPLIYLGIGWTVRTALRAGDRPAAEIIAVAALLGSFIVAWRGKRDANKTLFDSWLVMESIALLAINLRMRAWSAIIDGYHKAYTPHQMPFWSVNVAGAVFFLWMLLILWIRRPYKEAAIRS